MIKNYIQFENNEIVLVKDLSKIFPTSMLENITLRIDICEFIVNKYYKLTPYSLKWKVLVNILALRSNKIKIITMLLLISKNRKIKVIDIDFIDNNFQEFFEYDIKIVENKIKLDYIDKSQFYNAIIKFIINRFFILLSNRKITNNKSVIRAWTELDIELHKKVFYSSMIYIYPFGINIKRGFNFIKTTYKETSNVTLMGVPYSFYKLISIFLSINIKDLRLLEYEIDAMKKHSKYFKNYETIFTSDEYIPAIPILYDELIKEGKNVINVAHGMGIYNPYNIYTKFKLISNLQKNFYIKFEKEMQLIVEEKNLNNLEFTNKNLEKKIIFVHQANLEKFDLIYEYKFQKKILKILNSFNLSNIYIKLHPNTNKKEKKEIFLNYKNLTEIHNFDTNRYNYLFLTMFSSAYYDFKKYGEFIFIKDDVFSPENMFENINILHIDNLEKVK